jgi:hypothetical protein
MADNGKTASNVPARLLCIVVPLGLFLGIRLLNILELWKYNVAACIVIGWSLVIGCRIRITRRSEISSQCNKGFSTAIIEFGIVICLGALMLDHGLMLYACALAGMFYWMIAGIVVAHRPATPTPFDVFLITHGILPLAFLVTLIFYITVSIRAY